MALGFGLLDERQSGHAGDLLAEQVAIDDFRIGSFLGTPLVFGALADTGQGATAWALLQQRECPSWLYPVTKGATTIWERASVLGRHGRARRRLHGPSAGVTSSSKYRDQCSRHRSLKAAWQSGQAATDR